MIHAGYGFSLMKNKLLFMSFLVLLSAASLKCAASVSLEEAWNNPPQEAKIRAYWWWLNSNVTKEAITSDLEAMKEKGFGGAVIFDADGASNRGNRKVPAGPTFASPEWRKLFKHAVVEADRLGLTLSLNIQSGWNLGGPCVKADDAAKVTVWSETSVEGPVLFNDTLTLPKLRDSFFQDVRVIAWREAANAPTPILSASSTQSQHGPEQAMDGNGKTCWVSKGTNPGDGPSLEKPQWLQVDFCSTISANRIILHSRPGYGPRSGEIQVSDDGTMFRKIATFSQQDGDELDIHFPDATARFFRILITDAYDRGASSGAPRNVQVMEFELLDSNGSLLNRSEPICDLQHKLLLSHLPGSAPDLSHLLDGVPPQGSDVVIDAENIIDLTGRMAPDGTLKWKVPAGRWTILRFGATIGRRARVSTSSGMWKGYAIDPFDAGAFNRYWDAVVAPLIQDVGPLAGKSLKYLHTDSWEIEPVNWTPTLPAEFESRRGYELTSWLPVFAGRIVGSRAESNRFLADFRKTLGELAIDNHYAIFKNRAHAAGLEIHTESGGPHVVPIDAQRCLGMNDVPMSEFWAWSWKHRVGDQNRFFVKQPASAAHTYGRPLVMAEGFTSIGPHWQERLWNNLKPSFDKALTEGLNSLVWHAWVCSPDEMGIPGQQYFAGTHLNPKVTWWSRSKPFFDYINRSQAMLQRGVPVSDVLYYYGDHVPNYTQLRSADPAGVGTGYDYDVITAEALIERVSVKDGRLILPEGSSYGLLMLPELDYISEPVHKKIQTLETAGAVLAGPRSKSTARKALEDLGIPPDFSFTGGDEKTDINYIHRRDGETEIYFVASRGERPETISATFRVSGKAPELWDAVNGERRLASGFSEENGRTTVPLEFPPCGAVFVVFRSAGSPTERQAESRLVATLDGPWNVAFDPKWGGPESAMFETLSDWSLNAEPGIRNYSGTATYRKNFDLPTTGQRIWLDLGDVRELAEVRLNGKSLGILWTPPFRVEITDLLQAKGNRLEIDVVNFWPNRVIGDAALPKKERLTQTNVMELKADTPLMVSGLLGPVRILSE